LNARDENGCSPLHLAINDNYLAATTLLNTSGIQIDVSIYEDFRQWLFNLVLFENRFILNSVA